MPSEREYEQVLQNEPATATLSWLCVRHIASRIVSTGWSRCTKRVPRPSTDQAKAAELF